MKNNELCEHITRLLGYKYNLSTFLWAREY